MSTAELKSGITKMLKKTSDEKLLRIVFNLINDYEIEKSNQSLLSESQWKEINKRLKNYEAGKSKGFSILQAKQQIKIARAKLY